jgi:hypothetical protein
MHRTHSPFLIALALGVVCSAAAAGADKPADAKKITYDEHVLPIFKDKCVGCHNPDKMSSGLVLNNYTALMEGGASGQVVKPGDAEGSRLYKLVTHKEKPTMPPRSPMIPQDNLETIRLWIASGALENAGSTAKVNKPKVDIGLTSVVKGRPPGPPPMPEKPLTLDPLVRTARTTAVTAIAANPWSPLVAVAGQKQVLLYHADTLELLGVLPFPEGTPYVLKFSRNGSLLLAGGGHAAKSGRVVVWSVKTGERIVEVGDESDAVLAADISSDQTQIALGGPGKVIRIYGTKDGQLLREIKKHTDWVTSMEFSPDGVLLATGDRNGGLFVWEAFTGREYFSLRGHTAAITSVSWRLDSNVLASASEDTTVKLWGMENGGLIRNWGAHGGGTQAVQYGQDGRIVSCGRDRLVKVWDGNGAQQRAFEAMPDVALRTALSHDGSRVIAGDWTGEVRVWTTADGKPAGTLSTNPPTAAERLDEATKALAAAQAAQQPLAAAAAASKAAADKAAADLAAAQKAVTDTAAAAKTAADALPKAKAAVDQANAALAAARLQATAKDVLAKAFAEAAGKVKAAADQAKGDKDLTAAAAEAKAIADKSAAELAAVQKMVNDLTAAAKTAGDQLAVAQKAATDTAAAAAAAPGVVAMRTPLVKPAADKAAADKLAADQAAAAVADAQAKLDRLKAAVAVAKQPAK